MKISLARAVSIFAAAFTWAALALQLILITNTLAADGFLFALWRYLGFFTILTNLWVAATQTHAAMRPAVRTGLGDPRMELAATVAIMFVGITYLLLLAGTWAPQGWDAIADYMLHYISPILCAVFWLLRPHGSLKWRDALWCVVWPAAYCLYAFARGAFDGWYAYWFLNPSTLTLDKLALYMAGLFVAVLVLGLAMVALDRMLSRRRTQPPSPLASP